jgi:hypothetical protein
LSDPKGEKPHSDHPHEDEFEFEMHEHVADEGPHGHEHAEHEHAAGEHDPLDALGINASSEEFHFAGPAEELDFTEPADFTFPTEHAEAEASSDSSAEFAPHEHGGIDHLFGGDEAAPHEAAVGEEAAEELEPVAVAAEGEKVEAEEEKQPKPKRELPAWVRTLEWVTVSLLAVIGLIAPIVAIVWIADAKDKNSADTVSLIVNICFPMLLLLVPYALWRSSRRWTTPAASALYTVMLAIGVAALIGGSWVEATELSKMKWQFNKTRIAEGKPQPKPVPVFEAPAPAPAPAPAEQK